MKKEITVEVDSKQRTESVTERELEFVKDLRKKVSGDWTDIQEWRDKAIKANDQRMGEKRFSSTPYDGAPDIPLPETDKLIKKSVPNFVLSSWKPKNQAIVKQALGERPVEGIKDKIRKSQAVLNQYLRAPYFDWFNKQTLAADFTKNYGQSLFRVNAEYTTSIIHREIDLDTIPSQDLAAFKLSSATDKRQIISQREGLDPEDDKDVIDDIMKQVADGKKVLKYNIDKLTFRPNVEIPLPTKILVPTYTTDIENAERIRYEIFMSRREVEDLVNDGTFRDIEVDDVFGATPSRNNDDDIVEESKARNIGIANNSMNNDLFKIHIVNTWYREKDSDSMQRWVFMYFADVQDERDGILYSKPFHFEFDEWDYVKHSDENKDPRYYDSRGLPERIRAIQDVMERSVNNMLVRDEMNNTPIWEVLGSSEILDSYSTIAPGEKIPVTELGAEIRQLNQMPVPDQSSERILSLMKAYAEEYTSNNDQLFGNSSNDGGADTLGEIKAGVTLNQGTLNLDVINWNISLGKVYQKLFNIIKERLIDSVWVNGEEITPEDFNFNAEVVSNGSIEFANETLMLQKSFNRLQTILNPALQEFVNAEDKFNAVIDWLEKDGVVNVEDFTTDPKEIAQTQIAQMQQVQQQLTGQIKAQQEEVGRLQKTIRRNQEKFSKDVKNAEGEVEGKFGG